MSEQRREERHYATGSVDYVMENQDVIYTGLLSNLSDSGACIFTLERVAGPNVEVYFNGLVRDPVLADVMWCTPSVDNLYKAGLRFQN